MDTQIILQAELNPTGYISKPKEEIKLLLTKEGVFVNNEKITDIFYNGIQLRFYTSGSHKDNEGLLIRKDSFYMVFRDENNNDAKLSFKDLYKKACETFVLSPD